MTTDTRALQVAQIALAGLQAECCGKCADVVRKLLAELRKLEAEVAAKVANGPR
jgi:bacterioferritin-associated ferredoxin